MDFQQTQESPKVLKETKNSIRVEFERTDAWTKFKLKYFSVNFLVTTIWAIFRFILLLGISYVILQPFFAKIASSFMSREDFVDVTVKLIPRYPTLDTYRAIIEDNHYFEAFFNTLSLSLSSAIIQTFICSLIGYGFAKFKFKGSKPAITAGDWMAMLLICFVLPAVLTWLFGIVCRKLGWIREGDLTLN